MFGVPSITNLCEDVVLKNKCGLVVNYYDIDQIKKAIVNLRNDKDLRNELGVNGRNSYLQKFNWNAMENKLFGIYDNLLKD
jgi:glycosyltransferase involved in cell wall biosynthesis